MKAILEFNLNDFDEKLAHSRCVQSTEMACVLFEIQRNLKREILHHLDSIDANNPEYEIVDKIFEKINEKYEN